jgi:hypothetical protein
LRTQHHILQARNQEPMASLASYSSWSVTSFRDEIGCSMIAFSGQCVTLSLSCFNWFGQNVKRVRSSSHWSVSLICIQIEYFYLHVEVSRAWSRNLTSRSTYEVHLMSCSLWAGRSRCLTPSTYCAKRSLLLSCICATCMC